eukprot:gb/GFBE01063951.1/.p1 GENE.gb/GFBE01063951.1/~~gb/GFBE01063951.1/.p1  ORF type:complete len:354 (+),score=63.68 gb/GFBE01063951.1/:1-1062(+)
MEGDLQTKLFIATQEQEISPDCSQVICSLRSLQAISVHTVWSWTWETQFAEAMGSKRYGEASSFRQFFKLDHAYRLLQHYENAVGRRVDAVLKFRTDMKLTQPLALNMFRDLAKSVVYAISDVVFMCNRKVATALLEELLPRMLALQGRDRELLPIHYDRLLKSELLDADVGLLNFPCPAETAQEFRLIFKSMNRGSTERSASPLHRYPQEATERFKDMVRRHRSSFEAIRKDPPSEPATVDPLRDAVAWCTGAFWHNQTTRRALLRSKAARILGDGTQVMPGKAWLYLMHTAEPPVLFRDWPTDGDESPSGLRLHPGRHAFPFVSDQGLWSCDWNFPEGEWTDTDQPWQDTG